MVGSAIRWYLLALLGVMSCGGDGDSDTPNTTLCKAAQVESCVGPNGCTGTRACRADGSGWQACMCGTGGSGGNAGAGVGGSAGSGGQTGGAAGVAGAAGSGGGVSGPRAYVLFTQPVSEEAHLQVVDLETGAILAEKLVTSPVPNGTAQAISPLPDGTARVLWNQGAGMAVTANLDPNLVPAGTPFAYTAGDPPDAHAYARRADLSGVLIWAGFGGANRWSIDASGAHFGTLADTGSSATALPLSADYDPDDGLWILWADDVGKAVLDRTFIFPFGKIPLSQLPASELYRSVSVEATRVRIGIANDALSQAKVCTYLPTSAMNTIPTAVGWGINECAPVAYAVGWHFRGYYVSE